MATIINIVENVERKEPALSDVAVRFLLENILGLEVYAYDDEILPAPYLWGRLYFKDKQCKCIEMVDSKGTHYIRFSKDLAKNVKYSDAPNVENIVIVESFGIESLDEALEC